MNDQAERLRKKVAKKTGRRLLLAGCIAKPVMRREVERLMGAALQWQNIAQDVVKNDGEKMTSSVKEIQNPALEFTWYSKQKTPPRAGKLILITSLQEKDLLYCYSLNFRSPKSCLNA